MTMMTAALIGLLVGTMGTTGTFLWIQSKDTSQQQILDNQTKALTDLATIQGTLATGEQDIRKQLTDTDLLAVSCSAKWMEQNTDMLCREMFCRLQTREGDAASQSECEEISNIANTFFIIEQCASNNMDIDTCLKVLDTRK